MAKGGSTETTQKVELPPEIKDAALKNLGVAANVGALPYVPNFGLQMAAFTPSQNAAFGNTNAAANAFGMQQAQGTGLPKAQNVGGFSGYSTKDLYQDMMSKVNPQVRDLYNAFFTPKGREAMGANTVDALLGKGPSSPATGNSSGGAPTSGGGAHPDIKMPDGRTATWKNGRYVTTAPRNFFNFN